MPKLYTDWRMSKGTRFSAGGRCCLIQQATVASAASCSGVGVHTGVRSTITLRPAPADFGVVFQRVDLPDRPLIRATATNVVDSRRCTTLGADGGRVQTVEHLLSAMYALQIDNVLIEIDGPEVPIVDGGALAFVGLLKEAGRRLLEAPARYWSPSRAYVVGGKDQYLFVLPGDDLWLSYTLSYSSGVPPTQYVEFELSPSVFEQQIAPARTFVLRSEIDRLQAAGMALGGSAEVALVLDETDPVGKARLPNEPARHKVLDMLGDLALVGLRLKARVIGVKSGHCLNACMARELAAAAKVS